MPKKTEEQTQTPVEEVVETKSDESPKSSETKVSETTKAPVVEEVKTETTEEKKPAKKKTEVSKTVKKAEEKEEPAKEVVKEKAEKKEEKSSSDDEESEYDDEGKLVPTDVYLKTGIHVGTKFKTAHMKQFIYKTRPDGLSVLNVDKIDQYIQLSFNLLKNYEPSEILVVCRRENGWKPVKLLEAMSGVKVFAGRYPPGVLTNSGLDRFIEAKVMVVVDAWADRNAVNDALKCGIPVIALCDTNNQCNNVDLVVPCNNKGRKSLGLYFYLFAKEYMLAKGMIQ